MSLSLNPWYDRALKAESELACAREELRCALNDLRHAIDNLSATQARCTDLMMLAQAAAQLVRAEADEGLEDSEPAWEAMRAALKKIWPSFDG